MGLEGEGCTNEVDDYFEYIPEVDDVSNPSNHCQSRMFGLLSIFCHSECRGRTVCLSVGFVQRKCEGQTKFCHHRHSHVGSRGRNLKEILLMGRVLKQLLFRNSTNMMYYM